MEVTFDFHKPLAPVSSNRRRLASPSGGSGGAEPPRIFTQKLTEKLEGSKICYAGTRGSKGTYGLKGTYGSKVSCLGSTLESSKHKEIAVVEDGMGSSFVLV